MRPEGLLDTNVVLGLPTLDTEALPEVSVICAITVAELAVGPRPARDEDERTRRLEAFVQVLHDYPTLPLPFDVAAAVAYADVYAAVRGIGRKPRGRQADLGIAAIALANRLPLFTSNVDDFRGLEDLVTIVSVPPAPTRTGQV